jgi:hypothetical protein
MSKTITVSDETYEKIKDDITRLEQSKRGLVWVPRDGEEYFYLAMNGVGFICTAEWSGDDFDKRMLAMGNVFKDSQKSSANRKYLEALYEIKLWISENVEYWEPDWRDSSELKYFITYNHDTRSFYRDRYYSNLRILQDCIPFFKSPSGIERFIEAQEDNLKVVFGVEG